MAEKTAERLRPPFTSRPIPPKPPTPLFSSHASLPNGDISPQPVLDTATSIPLTALDSLPTIAGRDTECFLVEDDICKFLQRELDLKRLNKIHDLLWMAGRPMRARPLHRYKMMGFDVLYTQQMDLHLLKFSNRLLLKPLPEWMLSYEFWDENICGNQLERQTLHESACGFLLSYVWLLCSPLDLKLAHDHFLLPSFITWHWWKEFVKDFCQHVDMNSLDQVNKRYHFGDLRLGRINSIYRTRFCFTHFVRGYLYGYNRYVVFFQRNFSWILIVFVFFSLVLSAMQVGAGVPPLQDNLAFRRASYGFVVFSMVSVASVLALVGVMFSVIFFFNMAAAIQHDKRDRREREKLALERKNKMKGA
ncbi:uncharacterized protein BDR25DRAFT_82406 [Lindgomyces ingoldianus]|uniref:Uncharacterized protein n=1 Tax=Lindgomyces ingoldianus TaxID=673940 RepID=A0ACB6QFA4_9PLEO|nr:uncharacterized protein BDR25DRAFT_82406 [Lindgomyces ingoldianus]KAF2465704.1 hypothetical protein BDR25DRAFT_82406 [Lindgomyces ingoldianus]